MSEYLLDIKDFTVKFGRREITALEKLSLRLRPHQRLGLIGESGSGKSVTALSVMGLLPDNAKTTGKITACGVEITASDEAELSQYRGAKATMVFQEPMTALDPTMKVGRQIAEVVLLHHKLTKTSRAEVRDKVISALADVGLSDSARIANSFPHQLSGGQRQRALIAMATINQPQLIICDEPTTALDVTIQNKVLQLLDHRLAVTGAACLFISHDLAVVSQICREIAVMYQGKIVEQGEISELYRNPKHPYTRKLFAAASKGWW